MSDSSQVCLILKICQVLKIVMTHGKAMRTIPRYSKAYSDASSSDYKDP